MTDKEILASFMADFRSVADAAEAAQDAWEQSQAGFLEAMTDFMTALRNKTLEVIKERDAYKADSEFLARLEAAGVDNWEGYSFAFDEDEDEED